MASECLVALQIKCQVKESLLTNLDIYNVNLLGMQGPDVLERQIC